MDFYKIKPSNVPLDEWKNVRTMRRATDDEYRVCGHHHGIA